MVKIRGARPSDADVIADVHMETWLDAYAGIIPDRVLLAMSRHGEAQYWRGVLARPARRVLVLVAEGGGARIVGYASAGRSRDSDLPYDGEVYTLYVLPDHQGQGVGRRLLSELFGRMLATGFRSALIWVLADNPSRFFYQTMGGTWVAQREERYRGVALSERAYGWSDLSEAVALTKPSVAD